MSDSPMKFKFSAGSFVLNRPGWPEIKVELELRYDDFPQPLDRVLTFLRGAEEALLDELVLRERLTPRWEEVTSLHNQVTRIRRQIEVIEDV